MSEPGVLATDWDFSTVDWSLEDDLLAVGADLLPGTVLSAYVNGLFPMGLGEGGAGELGWWSPLERGILRRDAFRLTRSLKKSIRRFEVTADTAFDDVMAACADPSREGAWITAEIQAAYSNLHRLGFAHSVETWLDGELVGGLYGLSLGGLFAGESMFHRERDASKVALFHLQELVFREPVPRLIDVQWLTPHLASLGCNGLSRNEYRGALPQLLQAQGPAWSQLSTRG